MRRLAAFVCAHVVLCAACASIVDLQPIVFESPTSDAGGDAATSDDADTSSTPDADAGDGEAGCTHDFCDDFEGVSTPDQRWTGKEVTGTGELSLVADDGGANHVMRSSIAHADGGPLTAHIARVSLQGAAPVKGDGTMNKVRVAFRLKLEEGDDPPYFGGLAFIVIGSPPGGEDILGIELSRNDVDDTLFDVRFVEIYGTDAGANVSNQPSGLAVRAGTWTKIELQVNARPPGVAGGATLTVDGTSATYTLTSTTRPSYLRVDVGHGFGGGSGATFTSLVDDVAIDHKD